MQSWATFQNVAGNTEYEKHVFILFQNKPVLMKKGALKRIGNMIASLTYKCSKGLLINAPYDLFLFLKDGVLHKHI